MKASLLIAAVVVCVPGVAFGAPLFSSDMSTSAGWTTIGTGADEIATFGYDYGTLMGIPMHPGGTDTIGLRLQANTSMGFAGGATAYSNLTFSGVYQYSYWAWGQYDSTTGGSSEFFGGGIGHDQSTVLRPNGTFGSGGFLAMTTDGFSSRDYRMYKNGGQQFLGSGQYNPALGTNNHTDPAFAPISPSVDISTFDPPQTGQSGIKGTGRPGFNWHHVVISVDEGAGTARIEIDGLWLGTIDTNVGSSFPLTGAVSLFQEDSYSSVAGNFTFSVYDDIEVIPEPSALALLGLGGLALLRRRR